MLSGIEGGIPPPSCMSLGGGGSGVFSYTGQNKNHIIDDYHQNISTIVSFSSTFKKTSVSITKEFGLIKYD